MEAGMFHTRILVTHRTLTQSSADSGRANNVPVDTTETQFLWAYIPVNRGVDREYSGITDERQSVSAVVQRGKLGGFVRSLTTKDSFRYGGRDYNISEIVEGRDTVELRGEA